jgi:hypothetical protein
VPIIDAGHILRNTSITAMHLQFLNKTLEFKKSIRRTLTVIGIAFSFFDFASFALSDFFEPFAGSAGLIAFDFRQIDLVGKYHIKSGYLPFLSAIPPTSNLPSPLLNSVSLPIYSPIPERQTVELSDVKYQELTIAIFSESLAFLASFNSSTFTK